MGRHISWKKVDPGVYYYVIEATGADDKKYKRGATSILSVTPGPHLRQEGPLPATINKTDTRQENGI